VCIQFNKSRKSEEVKIQNPKKNDNGRKTLSQEKRAKTSVFDQLKSKKNTQLAHALTNTAITKLFS
jgi:hypothetical protein